MFSIVITTYNRRELLEKCIKSIENQSFKEWEIIILDDCSTDNTENFCSQFKNNPKFKYIKSAFNYGSSNSIFKEYIVKQKIHKFEYILYMSDDDFLGENSLLTCANLIKKYGKIDVLLGELAFNYGGIVVQSSPEIISEYFYFNDTNAKNALSKYRFMYHENLNEKSDMYEDSTGTYEVPYYKMYQNTSMAYSSKIVYVFDISHENRKKYLDIKNYITSIGELCYKEVNIIEDKVKRNSIFKENLLRLMQRDSNFLYAFDAFPCDIVSEYLSRFLDDKDFIQRLNEISTFLKNSFQANFNDKYLSLNAKLYTYNKRNEIINSSKTFMIYCQNEWGEQIKEVFVKKGLKFLGFIDDSKAMKIEEFLNSDYLPDFIFIATGKPKLMCDLIDRLFKFKGKILTLHEKDESV